MSNYNVKSLKMSVNAALNSVSFKEEEKDGGYVNKMLTGVLLFKYVGSILDADPSQINNTSDLVLQYLTTFKSTAESLKEHFISYMYIKKYLKSKNFESFSRMEDSDIIICYTYYMNKTEKMSFSVSIYDPSMYFVMNLNRSQDLRLSKIHEKIMCKIISHCMNKYGLNETDMIIYDSLIVNDNPGKKILFEVQGIKNSTLIYDIFQKDILNIKQYIYNMQISDGHILITIK